MFNIHWTNGRIVPAVFIWTQVVHTIFECTCTHTHTHQQRHTYININVLFEHTIAQFSTSNDSHTITLNASFSVVRSCIHENTYICGSQSQTYIMYRPFHCDEKTYDAKQHAHIYRDSQKERRISTHLHIPTYIHTSIHLLYVQQISRDATSFYQLIFFSLLDLLSSCVVVVVAVVVCSSSVVYKFFSLSFGFSLLNLILWLILIFENCL